MFTPGCVVYAKPEADNKYGITNTSANGVMYCIAFGGDWLEISLGGYCYSVNPIYFYVPTPKQKYINSSLNTGGNV